MLKFKPISITDKAAIDRYLQRSGKRSCDYAFANLFSWSILPHRMVQAEDT